MDLSECCHIYMYKMVNFFPLKALAPSGVMQFWPLPITYNGTRGDNVPTLSANGSGKPSARSLYSKGKKHR